MLILRKPAIWVYLKTPQPGASDKEALRAYQMRAMALSDLTSGFNHAREEGIQQGRQEGIQERGREIASRMKKRGVPVEQIAEYTGLSPEEISRI